MFRISKMNIFKMFTVDYNGTKKIILSDIFEINQVRNHPRSNKINTRTINLIYKRIIFILDHIEYSEGYPNFYWTLFLITSSKKENSTSYLRFKDKVFNI